MNSRAAPAATATTTHSLNVMVVILEERAQLNYLDLCQAP